MNELALFAGAGGGILGGILNGWRCVCAVELEPYCQDVLLQRQRDGMLEPFPIWDDVTTFDGRPWRGCVDIVTGGFPCQAYSSASRGRIVADDLWPEMRRIVADVAPRYVFTENVQKRAIDKAADELEQMGYTVRCVALSAADVGADHIRKRYWLAAHADNDSKLQRTVDAEASDMSGVRCSVWQTEPDQSGMAYGVAHRVDRLSAIGNGQVPAVVRLAWETLNHRTPVASQSGGHLSQPTAGAR